MVDYRWLSLAYSGIARRFQEDARRQVQTAQGEADAHILQTGRQPEKKMRHANAAQEGPGSAYLALSGRRAGKSRAWLCSRWLALKCGFGVYPPASEVEKAVACGEDFDLYALAVRETLGAASAMKTIFYPRRRDTSWIDGRAVFQKVDEDFAAAYLCVYPAPEKTPDVQRRHDARIKAMRTASGALFCRKEGKTG